MSAKSSKRLNNEFKNLTSNPVCNSKVTQVGNDLYKWKVVLPGPKGSSYEEGEFNLSFVFPDNYPFKCPDVKFTTPMYHPNIKKDTGEICMDVFANNWSPTQKVSDIIEKLSSLLMSPSTESPLESEIAQEFVTDHKKWDKKVREFVKKNKGK